MCLPASIACVTRSARICVVAASKNTVSFGFFSAAARSVVERATPYCLRERRDLLGVAPDQDRIGHHAVAVRQRDAALVADRQDRAHQVLVEPHASGDAVHDDAERRASPRRSSRLIVGQLGYWRGAIASSQVVDAKPRQAGRLFADSPPPAGCGRRRDRRPAARYRRPDARSSRASAPRCAASRSRRRGARDRARASGRTRGRHPSRRRRSASSPAPASARLRPPDCRATG